jgi:hypothetical protein
MHPCSVLVQEAIRRAHTRRVRAALTVLIIRPPVLLQRPFTRARREDHTTATHACVLDVTT